MSKLLLMSPPMSKLNLHPGCPACSNSISTLYSISVAPSAGSFGGQRFIYHTSLLQSDNSSNKGFGRHDRQTYQCNFVKWLLF